MRLSLVATTGCSHQPLHPFADATPNPLLLELRRAFAALLSLLSSSPSRLGWKSPWSLACRCMQAVVMRRLLRHDAAGERIRLLETVLPASAEPIRRRSVSRVPAGHHW